MLSQFAKSSNAGFGSPTSLVELKSLSRPGFIAAVLFLAVQKYLDAPALISAVRRLMDMSLNKNPSFNTTAEFFGDNFRR